MRKLFSNEKGFTLVEVIISIAILSVASVVVLRLFVTSVNLNTQSRHSDIASVVATNTIELLKTADTEDDLMKTLDGLKSSGNGYELTTQLNKDFADLANNQEVFYELKLVMTETDKTGLYQVIVEVRDLEEDLLLLRYETKHYLPLEVGLDE